MVARNSRRRHEQAFDLVVFGQAGDAGEAEADEAADFQRAAVLHGQIRKLGAAMTSATQENRPPRTEDMVIQPRAFSALPALAMA